ncbi:hypothetical protein [Melghirimyces algeriensis]|nr:hypothetical protein [Melghirimyces algeriensis]
MEHPFPTTQRNPWLGPEGVKRTHSPSLLEERDAETEIAPSPLCHEPHV